jgi:hypothetical protein
MAIGFLGHGHGLTSAMARDQRRSTMAIVLEVDFDFLILFERHNYIFTIIYLFIYLTENLTEISIYKYVKHKSKTHQIEN